MLNNANETSKVYLVITASKDLLTPVSVFVPLETI